jgi:capsular exopolysaccharide synthesis family protein
MNAKVDSRANQQQTGLDPHGYPMDGIPPAAYAREEAQNPVKWAWYFAKRRFWMIASVAVIGTVVAGMYGLQQPRFYTATAQIVIEPTDTRIIGLETEVGGLSNSDWTMMETQIQIARSPDVAQAVMARLGLERRMELMLAERESEGATLNPALQPFARLLNLMPSDILVASGLASEIVQLEVAEDVDRARRSAMGFLAGGLNVRQSGNSRVLSLSFTASTAAEAARVANAFADAYIDQQLARKVGGTSRASAFLETRLQELEAELRAKEEEIKNYRAENELIETSGRTLSEQELSQLSTELIQVRAERDDLQGRIRYIRSLRGQGDALETVGEILNSPLVAVLLQEHISLKRREAELLSTFGDRHPQVLSVRADLEGIVRQISGEADRYIASLENESSLLANREAAIREEMARATDDNVRISQAMIGLRELESERDNLRNLYNSFLVRYTEAREQRQVIEPDARIIAYAETPSAPSSRGLEFFLALGFVVSSALGVGLAYLRETLDRGLRTNGDVEQQLGLACLGQVPHLKSIVGKRQRPHAYLLERPRSAYAESIRSVATFLRMSNVDEPPRVIQVTSALPGEGKTTFAISLATLLAKSGQSTLLVDLDFHHPSVARELELRPDRCLVDYMVGDAAIDDILETSDFGLSVLPVRRAAPDPAVLVGSQRMKQLVQAMRERFDYIVVDTPPLLLVSDPKTTSGLVDATLLLVRWQETAADKAANALRELDAVNARVAGAVLSQVDVKRQEQYGYAGVGSYYSNYRKYYVD